MHNCSFLGLPVFIIVSGNGAPVKNPYFIHLWWTHLHLMKWWKSNPREYNAPTLCWCAPPRFPTPCSLRLVFRQQGPCSLGTTWLKRKSVAVQPNLHDCPQTATPRHPLDISFCAPKAERRSESGCPGGIGLVQGTPGWFECTGEMLLPLPPFHYIRHGGKTSLELTCSLRPTIDLKKHDIGPSPFH